MVPRAVNIISVTITLLFTQGMELLVTKKSRYTEVQELSVTTLTQAPTVSDAQGGEHHVGDYSVTSYTRKELSGTKRDETQKDRNCR